MEDAILILVSIALIAACVGASIAEAKLDKRFRDYVNLELFVLGLDLDLAKFDWKTDAKKWEDDGR